jgi:YVTN family beta-propeller protein
VAAPARTRPRTSRRRLGIAGAFGLAALTVVALTIGLHLRSSPEPPPEVVPDSVLEIDPETDSVVGVTKVGRGPDRLAFGGGAVWVVNRSDRTLSRVQASGEVDTIGGVVNVDHVVVDGDDVWLSSFDKASVARIDARSAELVETIGIPSRHAEGMAVGGGYLWITNPATVRATGTETVSRFDLRSREVVSTVAVGKTPIFTTFGFGSVWVSNYDDDTVSVISPGSTSAETIPVEDGPLGITTGFGSVWVVCYWRQQLLRIDPSTRRVVARIEIGRGPLSVAAGSGSVWVTNRDSRTVSRIDPRSNRIAAEIAIPSPASPQGVVTGRDAVWVSLYRCETPPCF